MGSLSQASRRFGSLAAVILLLGACSTAEYGQPVKDFATATGEADTALAQLNTQVTQSYGRVIENSILAHRSFVKATSGECLTTSTRCRLEITGANGQKEPYPPEPALARMSVLMAQINRYAGSLKALVEADTAAQAKTQVNAALGSVQNLAETIAGLNGPPAQPVPKFATPVGAAVNWVIGQYVDHVKFSGLQQATAAARPVVRDAGNLFTTVSTFATLGPQADLADAVSSATDAFRTSPTKANLTALTQSAARYDALLTATPPDLFKRMVAAHDALAASLQGENVTLADAIARIDVFAAEAKRLAKVLKDLQAIAPKEGG